MPFTGPLILMKLKGRKRAVLKDFIYIDKTGKKWEALKGSIVDGASIPRFFWRMIGGPWSGDYAEASVIHDVYCVTKSRPHKEVHRIFYEMMLDKGVHFMKAWLMFKAVWYFGPRWE